MQLIDHHPDSLIARRLDDDAVTRFLGERYIGRRYLRYAELEALGIVTNRACLRNWMADGIFPRGCRIAGKYGRVLVWDAVEIARFIAKRTDEREVIEADEAIAVDAD